MQSQTHSAHSHVLVNSVASASHPMHSINMTPRGGSSGKKFRRYTSLGSGENTKRNRRGKCTLVSSTKSVKITPNLSHEGFIMYSRTTTLRIRHRHQMDTGDRRQQVCNFSASETNKPTITPSAACVQEIGRGGAHPKTFFFHLKSFQPTQPCMHRIPFQIPAFRIRQTTI